MTFPKSQWDGFCGLVGTVALGACDSLPPPASPTPAPAASHATIVAPKQERHPETERISWQSRALSRQMPSITGRPVSMAHGKRCTRFRTLPFLEFHRDTLIQDACLEIPTNTTIVIGAGTTLGIIATNGLRVGKNVRFTATGTQGRQGNRADFESIRYSPDSDAAISAVCVDNGNQCTCPVVGANATAIRGHVGEAGSSGGFVTLVVSELTSDSQLRGLTIDVSGGRGGPPGESGRRECTRGTIRCESVTCTDGAENGAKGPDGHVTITVGSTVPVLLMRTLNGAPVPSGAITVTVVPSKAALHTAIRTLNDAAFKGGWDRRSGQEGY